MGLKRIHTMVVFERQAVIDNSIAVVNQIDSTSRHEQSKYDNLIDKLDLQIERLDQHESHMVKTHNKDVTHYQQLVMAKAMERQALTLQV